MYYFNDANWLWGILLIVPLLALLYFTLQRKKQLQNALGNPALVASLLRTYNPKRFVQKQLLIIVAIVLLICAMANFSSNQNVINTQTVNGIDVMLVLDISNSMTGTDEVPSRLLKAKEFLYDLCKQLIGNRVGLVVFAGNAYLQMPLSSDMAAAKMFIGNAEPAIATIQGTNIGAALALANKSLDTKDSKHKAVVLITDGENHEQDAVTEARKMAQNGTLLFAIGVGQNKGIALAETGTTTLKKDIEGNVVISKLNEQLLMQLCNKANGTYWHLDNQQAVTEQLLQKLQQIDRKQINSEGNSFAQKSYYQWFAIAALLLITIELFISEKKK